MNDYRPKWIQNWENILLLARTGNRAAHKELEINFPTLPAATAYRPFDLQACEHCGLRCSTRINGE